MSINNEISELRWQRLNAFLRVIMIIVLISLAYVVVKFGFSPCSKCSFCFEKSGLLPSIKQELETSGIHDFNQCVNCEEIMREYAQALAENLTEENARSQAMNKALWNFSFNISK